VHYTTSCNTQFSAPEDWPDHCPKYVELIGIINKPLLLHLFDVCITFLYSPAHGLVITQLHYPIVGVIDGTVFSEKLLSQLDRKFAEHQRHIL
jgi:hypothetical protein